MTLNEQIARYGKLPLTLQPELGRCTMSVQEIISLTPGSLIQLSRPLGDTIDINVSGVKFGSGELVRVGGVLSLRIAGFHAKDGE